jgi:isoleucyl-tRNA synthetase
MEEVWQSRFPSDTESVHLRVFPELPADWRDDALAMRWQLRRRFRRVVTGALEVERKNKVIGSSLEASPFVYVDDDEIRQAITGMKLDEVTITSSLQIAPNGAAAPASAYRLDDVSGVAVEFRSAPGDKCERCWRVLEEVGTHPKHPTLCDRCNDAIEHMETA